MNFGSACKSAFAKGPLIPNTALMRSALLALKHVELELVPQSHSAAFLAQAWFQSSWRINKKSLEYASEAEAVAGAVNLALLTAFDEAASHVCNLDLESEGRYSVPWWIAHRAFHWSERRKEDRKLHLLQANGSLQVAAEVGLMLSVVAMLWRDRKHKFKKHQIEYAFSVVEAHLEDIDVDDNVTALRSLRDFLAEALGLEQKRRKLSRALETRWKATLGLQDEEQTRNIIIRAHEMESHELEAERPDPVVDWIAECSPQSDRAHPLNRSPMSLLETV